MRGRLFLILIFPAPTGQDLPPPANIQIRQGNKDGGWVGREGGNDSAISPSFLFYWAVLLSGSIVIRAAQGASPKDAQGEQVRRA